MARQYINDNELLMKEWNWEKNNALGIFPFKLACGSTFRVWWKCQKCGHEWMTSVGHRTTTYKPTGCPKCAAQQRGNTRKRKLQQTDNIQLLYPDILKEWNYEKNISISPLQITKGSSMQIWWKCKNGHEWQTIVANRIKGHGCPYCTGRFAITGVNDLKTVAPNLAKEWNYEKNGDLKPENIKYASNKIVWWICQYGHEWQAAINNRYQKRGCPICSLSRHISIPEKAIYYYISKEFFVEENKKLQEKQMELDLFIPSLQLAIEYDGGKWHQNIDRDLLKDQYCKNHNIDLIRVREEGTPEYDSTAHIIKTKTPDLELLYLEPVLEELINYIKLKYNMSFKIDVNIKNDYYKIISQIKRYNFDNSLASKHPELLAEWNYEKNGDLKPENITSGSSRKVWWKCKNGHEWKTAIGNRTNASNLNQCPYCQRKKTDIGVNDIVTLKCDFLKDWDYSRNNVAPNNFMQNSGKSVWWKCSTCGYQWRAAIYVRNRSGCKYCGRKAAAKKRSKPVINVDTGEIFDSAVEAGKKYRIGSNMINRVCHGERNTTAGYHWQYLDNKKG